MGSKECILEETGFTALPMNDGGGGWHEDVNIVTLQWVWNLGSHPDNGQREQVTIKNPS